MSPRIKIILKVSYITALLLIVFYGTLVLAFRPSHDRTWELGQEVLPHIFFEEENIVTIDGFRNFTWEDSGEAMPHYESRSFRLDDIDSVDVYISHFDDFEGLAHIFLSFGLTSGEQIVISFETRREAGEEFSPLLGLLRQFEIIYVVGSEEDIVGVRTDIRDERVYLYPTKATKEQAQALFRLLASDINAVYEKPRMYNTLTHNCTNEITRRVEDIAEVRFPYSWKTLLPGYFDEILYDLKIIANDTNFESLKARHLIDNRMVNRNDMTFKADLRQNIEQQ